MIRSCAKEEEKTAFQGISLTVEVAPLVNDIFIVQHQFGKPSFYIGLFGKSENEGDIARAERVVACFNALSGISSRLINTINIHDILSKEMHEESVKKNI